MGAFLSTFPVPRATLTPNCAGSTPGDQAGAQVARQNRLFHPFFPLPHVLLQLYALLDFLSTS